MSKYKEKYINIEGFKDYSCKGIYKRCRSIARALGLTDELYTEFMETDDYENAYLMLMEIMAKHTDVLSPYSTNIKYECLSRLCTILYHYNRSLHFKVDSIPDRDISDMSILDRLNNDMFIDIELNGIKYCVVAFKRSYPVKINGLNITYTLHVFSDIYNVNDFNHLHAIVLALTPAYTLNICVSDNVKRVYVENPGPASLCAQQCKQCERCNSMDFMWNGVSCSYRKYPINLRGRDNCPLAHLSLIPNDVLRCFLHISECYLNRSTITRKNGVTAKKYNKCKVHIAKEVLPMQDKEVLLPLHKYVYEYKESQPYVYKGGHHASPIAHERRAHFRKARKHGDYIRVGDEFKFVGEGKGNYCYVRGTVVNVKKSV